MNLLFDKQADLDTQTEDEREMLERVEAECVTRGCGRIGDELKLGHVRIALTKAGEQ
jgi:hypothetical protein